MKKTLLTILLTMLSSTVVNASMVIIDYIGETSVHQASIERNLLINSDDDSVYDIAVKPLDTVVSNIDGSVQIPLANLYLNNAKEDVYFRYNEYSNLFNGLQLGGAARNIIAKIRDFGMVPAGTYGINLEIQATNVETQQIVSTIFNLQFVVPKVQEINLHNEVPKIVVTARDAFNKGQKVVNESSPLLYINSNCDWELYINADNFGEGAGNYYVRTVGASSGVSERLMEKVLLQPGKEFVIARGKAPANNENISVEFSLESRDGKFIPAGNYNNRVKYILREVRK